MLKIIKHIKIIFSCAVLILLTGCFPYQYRKTIEPELTSLQEKSRTFLHKDLDWTVEQLLDEKDLAPGLSSADAIKASILVDPALRALFEEIGISRADLAQAGYIQNPSISALFQFPRTPRCLGEVPYIDITGMMNISDFWQIPFKKKVAKDALEIQTVATLRRIIDISAEALVAYYSYLYEQQQLVEVEKILYSISNLQMITDEGYTEGYSSDYDRFVMESFIGQWEIKKLEQEKAIYTSLITLRNYIGLELIPTDIRLTSTWDEFLKPLPSATALFTYAEYNNPELQMAHLKVVQAQHQQSLERSRMINNVSFGLEYTQDVTDIKYIGPIIDFDIPMFDQQQAQIERARRAEKKAKREVANLLANFSNDIINLCKKIEISQKAIATYKKRVLPANQKALEFNAEHAHTIRMNLSVLLQTRVEMLQQEYNLNKEYLNLIKNIAELQQKIGGIIPYGLPTTREEQKTFFALQDTHFKEHGSFEEKQEEVDESLINVTDSIVEKQEKYSI